MKETLKQAAHRKYAIHEADMLATINNASYQNPTAILETLDVLAHQLGRYFAGLRFDVNNNNDEESAQSGENEEEESDESNDEENTDPTDEFIRDIKRPLVRSPAPTITLEMSSTSSHSQSIPFY